MEPLFLPTLHTFENNNVFTGSYGSLRFRIEPSVMQISAHEIDNSKSSMKVEYWHGQFCYEKSEMEGEAVFPMSEEGREAMRRFLEEQITDEANA